MISGHSYGCNSIIRARNDENCIRPVLIIISISVSEQIFSCQRYTEEIPELR